MAIKGRGQRLAYSAADYSVDVTKLGQMSHGTAVPRMRSRDSAIVERKLEPRQTSHLRFVGESNAKPTTKHYSVDLDEFQS